VVDAGGRLTGVISTGTLLAALGEHPHHADPVPASDRKETAGA
jgi:hypothetical protein